MDLEPDPPAPEPSEEQRRIAALKAEVDELQDATLSHVLDGEPYNALKRYLDRYRKIHIRKSRVVLHVLRWHTPGTVWAIDFTDAPQPIDGLYPYVLAVRDLASGCVLAALPVPNKEQERVVETLTALFQQVGPPLVMKSDWGFATERIGWLLDVYRVAHLSKNKDSQ